MSKFICLSCDADCDSSDGESSGLSSCCKTPLTVFDARLRVIRDPALDTPKTRSSQFRGVCAFGSRWRAQFSRARKAYFLGDYAEEITAAQVWDNAQFHLYSVGFFTNPPELNFPDDYATVSNRPAPFLRVKRLMSKWELMKTVSTMRKQKVPRHATI